MNIPTPIVSAFRANENWQDVSIQGDCRQVELDGRRGLHPLSVKTVLAVEPKGHTINAPQGSLSYWVLPMEDFGYANENGLFMQHEANCLAYPLLTDAVPLRDLNQAAFFIAGHTRWWRQLIFRFNRYGEGAKGFYECHGPYVAFGPCDLHLPGERWYQIGLTWNHDTQEYYLYLNGIRICNGHQWVKQAHDLCGAKLYSGTPAFAVGALDFYDRILTQEELRAIYLADPAARDDAFLQKIHGPASLPKLDWTRPADYQLELELPLNRKQDLEAFYIQGAVDSISQNDEALHIETPLAQAPWDGNCQVYLHTWRTFEGDLDVEFEFMTLKDEGLGLLMVHSNGMQREDYMRDYPLRTDSSMNMVHRENVRNYHWEFWREMDGIRSDTATHVLVKNPRLRPLAYQAMPAPLAKNVWHRVRLIQDGARLIGAINDEVVFDVRDESFNGSGPIYRFGHVSLRNMFKSKCQWRNLRIHVRPPEIKASALPAS